MFKIIVGENATGKTVFLLNKMVDGIYSREYLCNWNLSENPYYESIALNSRKLEILEDIMVDAELNINGNSITINSTELSKNCLGMLELLCKDIDTLFLDEPELGLTLQDICYVTAFINRISHMYKELYMVTHSSRFAILICDGVYTISEDGELQLQLKREGDIVGFFD